MTRGEVGRGNGEKKRRVKSRNMYKGPVDKDKGVGIVLGSRGWMGQGRATGVGRMGTTVTEQ